MTGLSLKPVVCVTGVSVASNCPRVISKLPLPLFCHDVLTLMTPPIAIVHGSAVAEASLF